MTYHNIICVGTIDANVVAWLAEQRASFDDRVVLDAMAGTIMGPEFSITGSVKDVLITALLDNVLADVGSAEESMFAYRLAQAIKAIDDAAGERTVGEFLQQPNVTKVVDTLLKEAPPPPDIHGLVARVVALEATVHVLHDWIDRVANQGPRHSARLDALELLRSDPT